MSLYKVFAGVRKNLVSDKLKKVVTLGKAFYRLVEIGKMTK
jgi:hypothetical protein